MGAIDALLDKNTEESDIDQIKTSTPKKSYQAGNFTNLSPNVQKILSNVSDQELNRKFSSDETLTNRRFSRYNHSWRSQRSPEKSVHKSNESLEMISPNVQKMLSNLPDSELVITTGLHGSDKKMNKNHSFLHTSARNGSIGVVWDNLHDKTCNNETDISDSNISFLYQPFNNNSTKDPSASSVCDSLGGESCVGDCAKDCDDSCLSKPLGNYLHKSPTGIASRTPVGRKNMGKFLQVIFEVAGLFSE